MFTIYFFSPEGILEDVIELKGGEEEVLKRAEELFDRKIKKSLRPLDKIQRLIDYPYTIVVTVRDKELTRGGEYIELAYLTSRIRPEEISERVWFFKREGVPISSMVKELLIDSGIRFRTYQDREDLVNEVMRIIYRQTKKIEN